MAGYIGSKASVTQVDGYNRTDADAEFVQVSGDTMTGDLDVNGTVTATSFAGNGSALSGLDADLLDGQQGSYYYPASNPSGYTTNVGDITGVTAGSGITGGGTSGTVTISHADTSSQGSVDNSGTTFIQDITLDTYGHITNIGSATVSVTPPTNFGAVGTYGLLGDADGTNIAAGATRAGSSLDRSFAVYDFRYASISPRAGTWRCMGYGGGGTNGTLFVRIS